MKALQAMKVLPSWWRIVLASGLATCAVLPLDLSAGADDTALERLGFALITRDGSRDAGLYTAVAIGADGLGLISYYDATNRDLKVAHCSNQMCTSATISSLDRVGDVGRYTSIALGSDDRGIISYYDATNGDLRVAHCVDSACTSATLKTLDHAGNVGQYSSLTIGVDKLPLITYYDVTNGDLKSAHCSDVACEAATITVTNLGERGASAVFGVIIPPQVAIVGFGRISERPWAAGGMVGARPVVTASLSADHRVSHGHSGARFLSIVARSLSKPEEL